MPRQHWAPRHIGNGTGCRPSGVAPGGAALAAGQAPDVEGSRRRLDAGFSPMLPAMSGRLFPACLMGLCHFLRWLPRDQGCC